MSYTYRVHCLTVVEAACHPTKVQAETLENESQIWCRTKLFDDEIIFAFPLNMYHPMCSRKGPSVLDGKEAGIGLSLIILTPSGEQTLSNQNAVLPSTELNQVGFAHLTLHSNSLPW